MSNSFNLAGSLWAISQLEANKKNNDVSIDDSYLIEINGELIKLSQLIQYWKEGHANGKKEISDKQQSTDEKKVESKQGMEGTPAENKGATKSRSSNRKSSNKKLQSASSKPE